MIGWILPVATILLMIYFSLSTNAFLTFDNLFAVANQNSATFVVAVAMAMLLMSGNIDLSVGSTMALAGVSAGLVFNSAGFWPGLIVGLLVGLVVGLINGVLIGILGFSAIVVTLGMLASARGVALTLAPYNVFGFPEGAAALGTGKIFGIPYLVIIALLITLLVMFVMNRLPAGRHIIAIGVNKRAAFLTGIRVNRTVMWLYVIVGLATGLAAIMQVTRLNSAPSASLGLGFEVTILTAVLLGGIPFEGGRGSIWRVVLGVWLIGVVKNGLTLLNIGVEISGIVTGLVLILAAALETLRRKVLSSTS
ncbi:ABC transporter permease [Leucobacter sp. gxy201]|uniref:ABC transporter permease n=1 Tax=Leucobacter sp. gxy201 TaxID=2957200 RepID=UPI003D9FD916